MKFLSISAALLALLSLVGFAINWSLINIDSLKVVGKRTGINHCLN